MAPSEKKLKDELKAEVRAVLASDERDELTVNFIRQRVAEKLDLDSDFFKQGDWKTLSKDVIHDAVEQYQESDKETAKAQPTSAAKNSKNNGTKRSSEDASPPAKRAKKEAPAKPVKKIQKKSDSESELSELDESEEEKPAKKGKKAAPPKKQPPKRAKKTRKEETESEPEPEPESEPEAKSDSESELSDLKSEEEVKPKKPAQRRKSKKAAVSDDDSPNEVSDPGSAVEDRKRKPAVKSNNRKTARPKVESDDSGDEEDKKPDSPAQPTPVNAEEAKAEANPAPESGIKTGADDKDGGAQSEVKDQALVDDDSSELSSVIDEPLPKRKRKSKGESGPSKPKSKSTTTKATKELTGDEAEIKKLQSHLVKCGVRKIWGFELKEYGDDTRAKIRHLKQMLNDVGMSGRFSESKAKEIKERRELMADLEAVQEMNDMWGSTGRGGRASRSRAKAAPKAASQEDDEDEDEEEDEEAKTKPRISKRMADLAFLGSESESD